MFYPVSRNYGHCWDIRTNPWAISTTSKTKCHGDFWLWKTISSNSRGNSELDWAGQKQFSIFRIKRKRDMILLVSFAQLLLLIQLQIQFFLEGPFLGLLKLLLCLWIKWLKCLLTSFDLLKMKRAMNLSQRLQWPDPVSKVFKTVLLRGFWGHFWSSAHLQNMELVFVLDNRSFLQRCPIRLFHKVLEKGPLWL